MRPAPDLTSLITSLLASGKSLLAVHYATGAHVVQIFCIREKLPMPRIPIEKMATAWPQEDLAQLLELMLAGESPTRIAARMPHRTKNSVIGTQHRYGLTALIYGKGRKRAGPEIKQANKRRMDTLRRKAAAAGIAGVVALRPQAVVPPPAPARDPAPEVFIDLPDEAVPPEKRVRILIDGPRGLEANERLKSSSCRWPLGNPQAADFGFCGQSAVQGLPYCEAHALRAFRPPTPRRRRAPSAPAEPRVLTFADAVEKELL